MTDLITVFVQYLAMAVLLVGILAFVVSVITQVIKDTVFLKLIPTDLVVVVLSLVLTVASVIAYVQYASIVLVWYIVVAAIILGFFVALVSKSGWSVVINIYKRCISDRPIKEE